MPFSIPRVLGMSHNKGESNGIILVEAAAVASGQRLHHYIEWLTDEINLAKRAYLIETGVDWDSDGNLPTSESEVADGS